MLGSLWGVCHSKHIAVKGINWLLTSQTHPSHSQSQSSASGSSTCLCHHCQDSSDSRLGWVHFSFAILTCWVLIWWESKALNARAARWYFCIPLQMQSQSVCYCYPWRHSLLELRWNILEAPWYELHICAITTHSSDWPKIWHKKYYDFNLLQNRHFTTDSI